MLSRVNKYSRIAFEESRDVINGVLIRIAARMKRGTNTQRHGNIIGHMIDVYAKGSLDIGTIEIVLYGTGSEA